MTDHPNAEAARLVRRTAFHLAPVAAAVLLAACGGGSPEQGATSAAAPAAVAAAPVTPAAVDAHADANARPGAGGRDAHVDHRDHEGHDGHDGHSGHDGHDGHVRDDHPARAFAPGRTLDGRMPIVVGHRGLPGLYPEETRSAYLGAAAAGADVLELDVHLSRDCVPVVRHNPWLSDNTTIATVAAQVPAVAARRRTTPGVMVPVAYDAAKHGGPAQMLTDRLDPADPKSVLRALVVDGEDHTNDWSITDFTVAELKQWVFGTTYDARDLRPTALNGTEPVLTLQEVIDIARERSERLGRTIAVYPETKNPYWNNAQAEANGCGLAKDHVFERKVLDVIERNGLNAKHAPVFVQSFDPDSLKALRAMGLKSTAVQLVDGNDVDYRTGAMIYVTDDFYTFVSARPYSWTLAGDARTFGDMLKPAGLAEVATYADAIGPWKPELMKLTITPWPTTNPDGTPFAGSAAKVDHIEASPVIDDAHRLGLAVHAFTFRNEPKYLAGLFGGDPEAELLAYYRIGLDGVFTDFAGTAVHARATFAREQGCAQVQTEGFGRCSARLPMRWPD